jgi:DNA topoisomerase VI subunit B
MTEEYDVNEIQASLTASKVLVAILETLGSVRVETKTLVEATNKDKQLVVDYDETGPAFIFRLPSESEFEFNGQLIEGEIKEAELINDFE